MERLLKDAEALTGVQYDISNLGDVYNAIHAIQEELGITGTTAKEAEKTITGSANMMKAAWENVLVTIAGGGNWDVAINNLVYSIEKYFENIVPVVERSLIGIGTLIERVAPTLVQNVASALIQSIPSLLNAVYRMIIGLAKGIKQGIIALFSGQTGTTQAIINSGSSMGDVFDNVTDSTEESADNIYDISDALDKAEKEAKKSLAAFDDLQILTSQKEEQPEFEFSLPEDSVVDSSQNQQQTTPSLLSPVLDTIKADILAFLPFIEIGLVVVGLLLIAFGQIGWGIGFIIAGAYLYTVRERSGEKGFDFSIIQQDLNAILPYIDDALVAIGLLLMFLGQIPIGIGFIIAGAIVYGAKEVFTEDYAGEDIITKLAIIGEAVSVALVTIGIILLFFGNFPLGLGFIVAGAGLLKVSEEKLDEAGIHTKIQKFFDDYKEYIQTAAWAMVALGFVLLLFGQFGLGLALIIGGLAINGVTEAVLDSDALLESIKDVCKKIKDYFWDTVNTVIGWLNLLGLNISPVYENGAAPGFIKTGVIGSMKEPDGDEPMSKWSGILPGAVTGKIIPNSYSSEQYSQIPNTQTEAIINGVTNALAQNLNSRNTEVVLEVDGREFGRAVVEQGGLENRRIGTRLVMK